MKTFTLYLFAFLGATVVFVSLVLWIAEALRHRKAHRKELRAKKRAESVGTSLINFAAYFEDYPMAFNVLFMMGKKLEENGSFNNDDARQVANEVIYLNNLKCRP